MRKFLSIALSLLLLFGNMGFSMATHYCGGRAVDVGVFLGEGDLGCGMERDEAQCDLPMKGKDRLQKKACCADHQQSLQLEDELVKEHALEKQDIDQFSLASFVSILVPIRKVRDNYLYFDLPPPAKEDLYLYHQVFLI